jgi:hypothetical protein
MKIRLQNGKHIALLEYGAKMISGESRSPFRLVMLDKRAIVSASLLTQKNKDVCA